jgi:hypothetical protein
MPKIGLLRRWMLPTIGQWEAAGKRAEMSQVCPDAPLQSRAGTRMLFAAFAAVARKGSKSMDEDVTIKMLRKLSGPELQDGRYRLDPSEVAVEGRSDQQTLNDFQYLIEKRFVKGLVTPDQAIEFEGLSSSGLDFLKTRRG